MTSPFVAQLRARREALQIAPAGAPSIIVRVEMPETWDTVKAVVSPSQRVIDLKTRVLDALYPVGEPAQDFVLKLRGWEVLNEQATLVDVGARDGSTFLLTHRRRRPVH